VQEAGNFPPVSGAVDVHAHAMPLPLLEWLARRGLADLRGLTDHSVLIDPRVSGVAADAPLPCPPAQYDPRARLAEMDRQGIHRQAVSLPPFLSCARADDAALTGEVLRRGNDELAALVAHRPDRLAALGTVPVGLPGAAEEAARCLDELGMAGVALGSQGGGRDLDDPVNEPLWEFLAARRVFCFLHPNAVPDQHRMREYWLPQLVGYPAETAIAVARLVFGGVLERHTLVLCLAHGGGCLPSLRGRLDLGWERKAVARTTPRPPSHYLAGLYYDTAVFSADQLARLVQDVGSAHVLLGTDSPFELSDTQPLRTIRALGLSEEETRRIARDNAVALLGSAHRRAGINVTR
jgi:aminocarboxymuconate-semialdehyde decarboxylase